MNKDIILGVLIGFIFTIILIGVGGFFLFPKLAPMFGLPGASQPAGNSNPQNGQSANYGSPPSQQQGPQSNGTLFGCPELKLIGAETVKSGVPFTIQNIDSKPHTIYISETKYDLATGEKKAITVSGWGDYTVPCDGSKYGKLTVGQ